VASWLYIRGRYYDEGLGRGYGFAHAFLRPDSVTSIFFLSLTIGLRAYLNPSAHNSRLRAT
jgi:hypothetical protein